MAATGALLYGMSTAVYLEVHPSSNREHPHKAAARRAKEANKMSRTVAAAKRLTGIITWNSNGELDPSADCEYFMDNFCISAFFLSHINMFF